MPAAPARGLTPGIPLVSLATFLSASFRHPSVVGAIAPSSRHLAACMIRAADLRDGQVVVEVGSGTGPVTRALASIDRTLPRFALEPLPELAAATRRAAPGVEVIEAGAEQLCDLLAARGLGPADRIISSLPFAAWTEPRQRQVLDGLLAALAADGRMVTFTYALSPLLASGRRVRRLLERSFGRVGTTPVVWRNLPPAFVYVCDRADQ